MKKVRINRAKLFRRIILTLLILACICTWMLHKLAQRYNFDGIGDFIAVYYHNRQLAGQYAPREIKILLDDSDYTFLSDRRNRALERGIQINDGEDNYVNCRIIDGADTVKGEMRLKGHMTDHLQGEKWSFRVKTKQAVMGMTRFSLQEPGTRNYAHEWIYHQLLKSEGVIYLQYDFIHLKLNDKDLGIYAVEEHFGQHVLGHNSRPKGAILRWNPELYWEWRIDELQGTYLDEQYALFSSSFAEPYEKGKVEDDPELVRTYQEGAALLEAFRRGEKKTSEVFDVLKMARFHAIIDLVGGHHSLDWSDVKFFYNSETARIEPVGYESFSVRKSERIAGQRVPSDYEITGMNYHDLLFADPVFFSTYITELERIADEKYLDEFMTKIQPELDQKLGVLAHEFPYRPFSFDPYFENIALIRHNLDLPKAFHAFREEETDSTIRISITPVSDFPIEIMALVADGEEEFAVDSLFVLPAKARNTYAHYFNLIFNHNGGKLKNLTLKARVPGSKTIFGVMVSDLPSYINIQPDDPVEAKSVQQDTSKIVFINDSVFYFNQQEIVLDYPFRLEKNEVLRIIPGQHLRFTGDGKIISSGRIEMLGSGEEGEEIVVRVDPAGSQDEASGRIVLTNGSITCSHVNFIQCNNLIVAYSSLLFFQQCAFADIGSDLMITHHSTVKLTDCCSGSMSSLGTFHRSLVRLARFSGVKGDIFLKAFGSDIDMLYVTVQKYDTIAILERAASLSVWHPDFSAFGTIAVLNNSSEFNTFAGVIRNAMVGFEVDKQTILPGSSGYSLYQTTTSGIGQMEEGRPS